jgi:hypothetical protein
MTDPIHVFVCYAREDHRWLESGSLIPYLQDSLRKQNVEFWFDDKITVSVVYKELIQNRIDEAHIVILLVSQHFLNSAFIEENELPRIKQRSDGRQLAVAPILVETCDLDDSDFLRARQMLPRKGIPLIDLIENEGELSRVKAEILREMRTLISQIRAGQTAILRKGDLPASPSPIRPAPAAQPSPPAAPAAQLSPQMAVEQPVPAIRWSSVILNCAALLVAFAAGYNLWPYFHVKAERPSDIKVVHLRETNYVTVTNYVTNSNGSTIVQWRTNFLPTIVYKTNFVPVTNSISVAAIKPPDPIPTPGPLLPEPMKPWLNSLEMEFLPVHTNLPILVSRYETRLKDFRLFAAEQKINIEKKKANGVRASDDDPVVNILLAEATEFCAWLTRRELQAKKLGPNQFYRLPTDVEWKAVAYPMDQKKMPIANLSYPWATRKFLPESKFANYAGAETIGSEGLGGHIPEYHDDFKKVAPAGQFKPNNFGLHDLWGNVWEWCARENEAVLLGGAWDTYESRELLVQAQKIVARAFTADDIGFRCVLVLE